MEVIENVIARISREMSEMSDVVAVFLYGSAARGDYSPRHSDIDIMVFLKTQSVPKRIEEAIKSRMLDISAAHKVRIHPEFQGTAVQERDKTLIQKILEEGRLIFSNGVMVISGKRIGLEPFYLYAFSTKERSKRPLLSKALHGGRSWYYKGGKKISKDYHGMIDNVTIIETGKGSLLVKKDRRKDVESAFKIHGADYSVKKILYG